MQEEYMFTLNIYKIKNLFWILSKLSPHYFKLLSMWKSALWSQLLKPCEQNSGKGWSKEFVAWLIWTRNLSNMPELDQVGSSKFKRPRITCRSISDIGLKIYFAGGNIRTNLHKGNVTYVIKNKICLNNNNYFFFKTL